jgi:hypothetical protein
MDRGDAERESRCMTDRDNVIRFNRHLDHARELEREGQTDRRIGI